MSYNYKSKKRNFSSTILSFIFILVFIFLLFSVIKFIDGKILPYVIAESDMISKTKINIAINNALSDVVKNRNLVSTNFFQIVEGEDKKMNSLYVDTILISELCNEVAVHISDALNKTKSEDIKVPLGTITGIKILANRGPKYNVSVKPVGNAVVDYETSFVNVGINQVNFQVWLLIESQIQLINPIQDNQIKISRRVPLVNTVINSDIPANHLFPMGDTNLK